MLLSSDLLSEAEQAEKFFEMFKINQKRLIIKKLLIIPTKKV